ncbi:MAG: ABC transporter ATP-binding protein, partial [Proteobacteria bacterium]|nr:ABC transporter ATP-binding protein [Pseudomonadota bacterium]
MLTVDAIDTYYGEFQALEGVSLKVEKGQTVIVVGPNGAGKSTLLKTILGLQKARTGSIKFQDEEISGLAPHKVVERGISMVPEGGRVFPELSVQDNLRVGSYNPVARPNAQRQMEQIFSLFPILSDRKRQAAGSLSGGERQMLAIARSLMSCPKLIMLDEPSLGLAPLVVNMVFDFIQQMKKEGYAILLVEQNANKALKVADYAYLVESGKLVY